MDRDNIKGAAIIAGVATGIVAVFWCIWAALSGGVIPANPVRVTALGLALDLPFSVNRAWDVVAMPAIIALLSSIHRVMLRMESRDKAWVGEFGSVFFASIILGLIGNLLVLGFINSRDYRIVFALTGVFFAILVSKFIAEEAEHPIWFTALVIGFALAGVLAFGLLVGGLVVALLWSVPILLLVLLILGGRVVQLSLRQWFAEGKRQSAPAS